MNLMYRNKGIGKLLYLRQISPVIFEMNMESYFCHVLILIFFRLYYEYGKMRGEVNAYVIKRYR